jgi:hypothetical protein
MVEACRKLSRTFMKAFKPILGPAFLGLLLTASASASPVDDGFKNPPDSAKPHTWWHWLNGNVTRQGITKDLEAMKAVGLGGFQQFDVGLKMIEGPVVYNSKAFHELMAHAIAEANRLGLEAGFNNASGWSSSGGPWITPETSMKTLVWSEMTVLGGEAQAIVLSVPDLREDQQKQAKSSKTDFYHDVAVLAFPTPKDEKFRIKNWSEKTLQNSGAKSESFGPDLRTAPANAIIAANQVIVLSDRMNAQGKLNWTPPAGEWTVMRIGYTSTRAMNRPGSKGGIGLEVDKLSRKAVDVHWNALVGKVIADAKGAPAFTTILIDSYEVGMNNWTEDFQQEFRKRRGYDLIPRLLCISGRVLDNTETTERVLWDLRSTVAELMHENYFGYFAEKCHALGLKLAIEPYGSGTFDAPTVGQLADVPMTEFWQGEIRNLWQWTGQVVTSAAHLTGRHVVGAESLTSMKGDWKDHPYTLKKFGDQAFAQGVNRYYFHTFAHQPWNDSVKPGMTMGGFGGNFHRNNTWFPKSKAWMDYIARCQFIMQSGTYQADVLALYGDERGFNNFLGAKEPPDMKESPGIRFDLGGMSSLENLSVDANHEIRVTFGGKMLDTRYKVLLLKRADLMTPAHVAKLGALADQGAKIFAPKPLRAPSLQDHAKADQALQALVKRYWDTKLIKEPKEFNTASAALVPDCEVPEGILFNRHRIGADDYYFISNQKNEAREINAKFRVSGKQPELWNPLTGEITGAPNWKALEDGRTEVNLSMTQLDSLFVVFRKPATDKGKTTPTAAPAELLTLDNKWTVAFDPKWGPKQPVALDRLMPWNESSNEEVKYFSGTAIYRTTFELPKSDTQLVLDLGDVQVLARVTLNGKDLGTLWKPPFVVKIGDVAKAGINKLEVEITNLWVNRLIGDERLPKFDKEPEWLLAGKPIPDNAPRKTFAVSNHWKKDSPLLPSGLIGPVRLLGAKP